MKLQKRTILMIFFLAIIAIVTPLAVFFSEKQQRIEQHAAGTNGDVVVDFGNRQNHSHPISQTFLGVGGLGLSNVMSVAPPFIAQANLRLSRIDVGFETIFPTASSVTNSSLQNWTKLDPFLTFFLQNHMTPVLILDYTPSWLQPTNNPCTAIGKPLSHVKPTDVNAWGQLGALLVKHIDQNFPNLHPLYEFWNEPSGSGFWCEFSTGTTADQQRLTEYKQLWAAAGPQMRQQAQSDGVQITMGGPALDYSQVNAATWIPSIVNDVSVAPYIDFISYHHYIKNATDWPSLVSLTQGMNTQGHIYLYQDISSYVKAGKQPNPGKTPIILDEYNASTCNSGQCRNDPTYGPLWNSLFLVDMLNTVLIPQSPNGVAQSVPAGLSYFTWSNPGGQMCLIGVIDTALDCSPTGTLQPYPQYYTYQLFGGNNYLNITDAGYTVNSVLSNLQGVYATGFYTSKSDNIVIVNTGTAPLTNLNVAIQNPGTVSNLTATVFTLNQANPQISKSQTTLAQAGSVYTAFINVPALSTVALSINASEGGVTPSPTSITSLTPTQTTPSPTSSPTPTSGIGSLTPTPTFPPGSTVFNVSVCPHGLGNCGDNANPTGGNTKPYHTMRNAKLFIYDSNNNLVDTRQMVVQYNTASQNFQGTIASNLLSSGVYMVAVKMDEFLTKRIPQAITITKGQTVTLPLVSLISGDLFDDNQLDAQDYGILVSCYGSKATTSSCPAQYQPGINNVSSGADILDDDLQVDGADYNEFIRELSTQVGG